MEARPNFAKTKRGASGGFLPRPLLLRLRHPNSEKRNQPKFCGILSPENCFRKTSSALFPFHSFGFSAKWVLTFSNKHHHSEFEEELTSPAPKARARAGIFAKKFQGVLNSAKRIPAESRRFPNEVWIVPKAQEPMNRDFKIVGVMQNLLSI
jgi:hypothetical protein